MLHTFCFVLDCIELVGDWGLSRNHRLNHRCIEFLGQSSTTGLVSQVLVCEGLNLASLQQQVQQQAASCGQTYLSRACVDGLGVEREHCNDVAFKAPEWGDGVHGVMFPR